MEPSLARFPVLKLQTSFKLPTKSFHPITGGFMGIKCSCGNFSLCKTEPKEVTYEDLCMVCEPKYLRERVASLEHTVGVIAASLVENGWPHPFASTSTPMTASTQDQINELFLPIFNRLDSIEEYLKSAADVKALSKDFDDE
jgi:hypothetical protein